MVDHVVDAVARLLVGLDIGEAQRAVVVVQLERGHARGVGLEAKDHDIAHETHVLRDVLRDAVGRALDVRLVERRAPALQLTTLSRGFDALLDVAHGVEILVQLLLVGLADVTAEISGVIKHGIEYAAVARRSGIFKETVESQRGIDFQRGRGRRRAPRDVRAVEHGVVLVHAWERAFAREHEAGHLGRTAIVLRD